jgi:short-subunit dehydrogenase
VCNAARVSIPAPHPDHTCVVTGASSGIGREIARLLAARGLGVTLVARREDRLRTLADELVASHGTRAEVLAADLTDEASRDGIATELAARGLAVDVLVNNAGFSTVGAVAASTPAREIAMVRTNVEAVVHLCSLFVPAMVAAGAGAILNVASTAAFQPLPGQAGYGASKSFVLSYSQALRTEVRPRGVSVTVLCPGPVETEFGEAAGFSTEDLAEAPLPQIMWVPATEVAAAAVDGLDKGRAVVIPGTANRVSAAAAYLTPRRLLLPILAKQHPGLNQK